MTDPSEQDPKLADFESQAVRAISEIPALDQMTLDYATLAVICQIQRIEAYYGPIILTLQGIIQDPDARPNTKDKAREELNGLALSRQKALNPLDALLQNFNL